MSETPQDLRIVLAETPRQRVERWLKTSWQQDERLNLEMDEIREAIRAVLAESEELVAQVDDLTFDKLRQAEAERDALRAKVERLHSGAVIKASLDAVVLAQRGREKAEAALREIREWLTVEGYHAPGKCHHGLTHWIGDHCAFDCTALRDTAPAEKPKP